MALSGGQMLPVSSPDFIIRQEIFMNWQLFPSDWNFQQDFYIIVTLLWYIDTQCVPCYISLACMLRMLSLLQGDEDIWSCYLSGSIVTKLASFLNAF